MIISIAYSVLIYIYSASFIIASLFNPKAKKRLTGLNNQLQTLQTKLENISSKRVLIHCASLGEYEQIVPIIIWILDHTNYDIVVSFFSPSGYEDCELVNNRTIKCYLPFDTKSAQESFIDLIHPQKVIIAKNEWWWNLLFILKEKNITSYLVSSTIRKDHYFIKYPIRFFKRRMSTFKTAFVINKNSKDQLNSIFQNSILVSGDTRKDRVRLLKNHKNTSSNQETIIYGSVWRTDLHIIKKTISLLPNHNHLVYPHDLNTANITSLCSELSCTHSDFIPQSINKQTVVITSMGQLKKDYAKASIAYVGGGFGEGIHNILEAVVFEIPTIIGPKWHKSEEARELIQLGTVFPINDKSQVDDLINDLKSQNLIKEIKLKLKSYFSASQSATEVICKEIFQRNDQQG